MAEFVTKAENQRRLAILIVCVIADTLAIGAGIFAIKGAGDIESGEENRQSIVRLRAQLTEIRGSIQQKETQLIDFSRPIGWSTISKRTTDRLPTDVLHEETLEHYLDFWAYELAWIEEMKHPEKLKYKKWMDGGTPADALTLTALFNELREKVDFYKGEIARVQGEIRQSTDRWRQTHDQMISENAGVGQAVGRGEQAGSEIAEYIRLMESQVTQEQTQAADLASSEQGMLAKQQEIREFFESRALVEKDLVREKEELTARRDWILHRQQEAQERRDPDGVILEVDEKMKVAWIDLAHRDRLFRGTKFRVYSLKKGGEKLDTGEVQVIEVGEDRSKVAILRETGDGAVRADDRIYNEYYERGKPAYIAFAGRFTGKLSNLESARKVADFGDLHQEKVDEKTNYLIVGEGYAEDPNFVLAEKWGVKILLERYLYDYLGVP